MADEELDEFLQETSAENVTLESAHKSAADHNEKEKLPLSTLDIPISEVRFFRLRLSIGEITWKFLPISKYIFCREFYGDFETPYNL